MKQELEEIKYIEDYLLNRLNTEEKLVFESKMKTEPEFALKVKMQTVIIRRVQQIALKQSVNTAHSSFLRRQKFSFKNSVFKYSFNGILTVIAIVLITYAVWVRNQDAVDNKDTSKIALIQAPLQGIDVPYITDSLNAEHGAVINYSSGSIVIVPPNAFTDENGNSVKGTVELKFREFRDATDIYLAGIPMNYEQDGEELVLESAAMCEINAFKNGKALKIKQGKSIEIMQASYTNSDAFNLYRFNKKEGKWIEKGKDIPMDLNDVAPKAENDILVEEVGIEKQAKPFKPKRTEDFNYSFTINVIKDEFPELAVYENVKFVVDKNDKEYKPSHADVEWEDVLLKKGNKNGSFIVTFIKGNWEVNYLVYPAFSSDNYEKAMAVYNEKLKKYNNIRTSRVKKETKVSKELLLANQRQDSVNKIIEARNVDIKAYNVRNANIKIYNKWLKTDEAEALINMYYVISRSPLVEQDIKDKLMTVVQQNTNLLGYSKLIEKTYKKLIQAKNILRKRNILLRRNVDNNTKNRLMNISPKINQIISNKKFIETSYANFEYERLANIETSKKILRVYSIDKFGIWNCDQPIKYPSAYIVKAEFRLKNKQLPLNQVNLVDKDIRSVFAISYKKFDEFKYNPNAKNVIWTVIDGNKLIYFNKFNSIPKNTKGKAYIFNMKAVSEPLSDYEKVREIINSL